MMQRFIVSRGLSRSATRSFSASHVDLFNKSEEHAALRDMVKAFAKEKLDPQAMEYDQGEKFNRPLFNELGELGLLGVTVDEAYGGSGLDAAAACIIHEELSSSDPGFTLSYLAHSMLFVNNVSQNASHEQKLKYLPDACSGAKIGGMCMSEPDHGTDVLGMRTSAKKVEGGYRLNGTKMWITNGCVDDNELGDVFLVYAMDEASASLPRKTFSMFIVEKGMEGFKLGQRIKNKCGMRASPTAELVFDDVFVSDAQLVGDEGKAIICMMRNLEIERVTLGAMATGIAKRCIGQMNGYAKERKAFGKPLHQFGQMQRYLANSYAEYQASRTYLYNTANNLSLSTAGSRLETDGVKLVSTTMAKNVADNAMQVLGGNGYMAEYQVERLWRDSKLLEIGGGTLESHQKNMSHELIEMTDL